MQDKTAANPYIYDKCISVAEQRNSALTKVILSGLEEQNFYSTGCKVKGGWYLSHTQNMPARTGLGHSPLWSPQKVGANVNADCV